MFSFRIKYKIIVIIILSYFLINIDYVFANNSSKIIEFMNKASYEVYQNDNILQKFEGYKDALNCAQMYENASVVYKGVVWHNFTDVKEVDFNENKGNSDLKLPPLEVYQLEKKLTYIDNFTEACDYAKNYADSFVYGKIILWDNFSDFYYYNGTQKFRCESVNDYLKAKKQNLIISPLYKAKSNEIAYELISSCNHMIKNVQCIAQNPHLPRGCEVTSLAMMLNYHNINVSKMTLAEEIKKIPYKEDPNKGFIGNMYNMRAFGFGVYHSPIAELAENYAPSRVIDLTGCDFNDIYYYISNDKPVWVINNSNFNSLSENYFEYWDTPSGKFKITYKEHSVIITGIDDKYVYINDALTGSSRSLNKSNFINGWIQMGKQCVIIE